MNPFTSTAIAPTYLTTGDHHTDGFVRTNECGCEPLKFVPDEVVQAARVLRRYIEQQEKPDPITEVIEKFRTQGVD